MPMRKFYVSSKLKHGKIWTSSVALKGIITSSWIYTGELLDPETWGPMWDKYLEEIALCTDFVMYVEKGDVLRGALIEAGAAMMLEKPIQIIWDGEFDELRAIAGSWITHESVTIVKSIEDIT